VPANLRPRLPAAWAAWEVICSGSRTPSAAPNATAPPSGKGAPSRCGFRRGIWGQAEGVLEPDQNDLQAARCRAAWDEGLPATLASLVGGAAAYRKTGIPNTAGSTDNPLGNPYPSATFAGHASSGSAEGRCLWPVGRRGHVGPGPPSLLEAALNLGPSRSRAGSRRLCSAWLIRFAWCRRPRIRRANG